MRKRGKGLFALMKKRGLSTVVITLIIILISLVAVGIIWVVVRNVIQTGTKEVTLGQFTLDAKILNVNTDNSSNNVSLTVKRNAGAGEFTKMNFVFSDGTKTEVITLPLSMNELEQKSFMFHLSQLNVNNLISISIVPYVKQDEKEVLGTVLDKYTISGGTSPIIQLVCTPATCASLGYECGTNWANGTNCAGTLNCDTPNCTISHGSGYNCVSGTCVFGGSCSPYTCAGQGYQCGTPVNGTCSGNLNCGPVTCDSYGTGYTCTGSPNYKCVDTTAPVRTNAAPTGTLAAGTTQTNISLNTSENARCKYSNISGTAYASMTNTFTTTGATSHSQLITGLRNGTAYNYYVRCNDTAGNFNTNDYAISFSVAAISTGGYAISPSCSFNGNGASWSCAAGTGQAGAMNTIPSTLVRGNKYYLADGTYPGNPYALHTSGSSGEAILIKAIESDHGPSVGWNSNLGDGVAVFTGGITIDGPYLTVDGQTGGGPLSWKSGFGIRFNITGIYGIRVPVDSGPASHLTVRHVDFNVLDGVEAASIKPASNSGMTDYGTVEYSYFHCQTANCARVDFHYPGSDWLIQYNYFGYNGHCAWPAQDIPPCSANIHKELISSQNNDRIIFRWNTVTDISNTGVFGLVNPDYLDPSEDWEIYGNVFAQLQEGDGCHGPSMRFVNANPLSLPTNWKVFDNTFINFRVGVVFAPTQSGVIYENNLHYHNAGVSTHSETTGGVRSYNSYIYTCQTGSPPTTVDCSPFPSDMTLVNSETGGQSYNGDPFVNWQNENYALSPSYISYEAAGITLSSPYNVDMYGNIRGADGKWDRGAIEYT